MERKYKISLVAGSLITAGILFSYLWKKKKTSQQQNKEQIVLIGDIGGTNCRLELITKSGKSIISKTYPSQDYPSLKSVIVTFLSENKEYKPVAALFGCAGIVRKNTYVSTNCSHWGVLKSEEISQSTNIPKVIMVNDFVLMSYGILNLKEDDLDPIYNKLEEGSTEIKAIAGPGTGLGTAFMTFDKSQSSVWPSEGGHIHFWNNEQHELCKYLLANTKFQILTAELAICGQTFHKYYEFYVLKPELKDQEIEGYNKSLDDTTKNRLMIEHAKKGNKACVEGIKAYMANFGIVISDIALQRLCYGGFYIVGGLIQAIQANGLFEGEYRDIFIKSYERKLEILSVNKDIPIVLVKRKDIGILGAKFLAQKLLN